LADTGRYLGEAKASRSLADLVRGTQAVLPSGIDRAEPANYRVTGVKWTPMLGVKSIISSADVKRQESPKTYKCVIDFYGLEKDELPSWTKTPVRVACSCKAQYFYFAKPNELGDAHARGRVKPYVPVSPPSGRPPLNPSNIPGMCKHLLAYAQALKNSGQIKD
jgi:hypothetical protein